MFDWVTELIIDWLDVLEANRQVETQWLPRSVNSANNCLVGIGSCLLSPKLVEDLKSWATISHFITLGINDC